MRHLQIRLRRQSGQAIVLIALLITALIGFLGLAVDGGRVFIDRREQQAAADSAALAAADKFITTLNMPVAFQAGASEYASNSRITGSPSASPAWCASPPSPPTAVTTCTATIAWPGDSHTLQLTFTDNRSLGKGIQFDAGSTHSLPLAFMQVLGVGTPVADAAQASTVIFDQSQTPAILTLGRSPCNGTSGNSLSVQGGAGLTVQVVGAVYSDGGIGIGGSSTMEVAGNAYSNCGGTPISGISNSGYGQYSPVAPIQNNYLGGSSLPWASNYNTSQTWPSSSGNVEVYPGQYSADPRVTSNGVCYFMDGGMYTFNAGFTDNAGLVSNELRPPDEPSYSSNTVRAGDAGSNDVQFWRNGVTCDGAFAVHAADTSTSHPLPAGSWGIELTTGRIDQFYPNGATPVNYVRESAPSICRTVNPNGANQGFQVAVSNVPGAEWYNIYANPAGCTGSFSGFGYIGSFCSGQAPSGGIAGCSSQITMTNQKTSGCPNLPSWSGTTPLAAVATQNNGTCSLGYAVSQVYNTQTIQLPFSTLPTSPRNTGCMVSPTPAAQIAQGCPAPDPELCPSGVSGGSVTCISTTANAPAARNSPYTGDAGDENECMDYSANPATCPGQVTPGAVQIDFTNASNSCLSVAGGGGVWVFSGQQYGWIAAYSTNSTCGGASPNKINGSSATSFIGTLYFPQTSITLSGNGQNAIASQLIALNATIDGSSGVTIAFNPNYALPPPAGRLVK